MPRMDGQQPRRHAQRDVERQPRQIRLADQQEILVDKVENVVKLPQNPTIKSNLISSDSTR